jgi:hypothetical protein
MQYAHRNDNDQFAHSIYTSYLWNSSPDDMLNTVEMLIAQAEEYGIELDYDKFGIIKE